MAEYLLDTNHLSPLVTPGHPLRGRVAAAQRGGDRFYLTTAVAAETLVWVLRQRRATGCEWEYRRLRPKLRFLHADEADAERSAELRIAAGRRGWQLKVIDGLIAATALRYDLTLLTADRDFHGVPNLRVENRLVP